MNILEQARSLVARKVVSIVLYVVAGFFVYMVTLLAFVNMSALPAAGKPPAWSKFAVMGGFSIPAVVALLIGLAVSRFQHWKRDVGIVLVSGAGMTAFIALTMVSIISSKDFKQYFTGNELDFFSDYVVGVGCILMSIAAGAVLIKISRRGIDRG
jgi:hypothetical protein